MPTIIYGSENPPLAPHAVDQAECIRHAEKPKDCEDYPGYIGESEGDGDDHENGNEGVEGYDADHTDTSKEDIALGGVEREAGDGEAGPTVAGGGVDACVRMFGRLGGHGGSERN